MSKGNKVTAIIIFLFLALTASLFYIYLKNFKTPQNLTYYMPQETIFYAEFNLKDKNLPKVYENNPRIKNRIGKLIQESGFYGELSPYLIDQANKVALLVVDYDNNWHKVWLVNSDNIHYLSALLPVDFYVSILNSRTIALSKNRDSLKLVKEVDPLTEYTRQQKEVLNKFSFNNFINIYLAGSYLKFLSKKNDPAFNLILNNLNLDYDQPAFLGLGIKEGKMVYSFFAKTRLVSDRQNQKEVARQYLKGDDKNILKFFPVDDLFLIFISPNLKDVFGELERLITENQKEEWVQKYEFSWDEIESLLDHPGAIFVQGKDAKVSSKKIFNLSQYNYGLMIKTDLDKEEALGKIERIKKVVKNILAFKHPVEKAKLLPDGSQSIELVADTDEFSFNKDGNVEYYESQGFSFAMGCENGFLILGNSKNLVQQLLNIQLNNKDEKAAYSPVFWDGFEKCQLPFGQEMAVINSDQLTRGLLSYIDQVIISVVQEKDEVKLEGCLRW